jgi:hypothetical protein
MLRASPYLFGALIVIAPGMLFAKGQNEPELSAAEIIRRSVVVNDADWRAQPEFSYREQDVKTKLDASGRSELDSSKTYEVMMIEGSPYNRLIAINNEPLTPALEAREKQKLQQEILKRQSESPSGRNARMAKYKSDRAEEHLLMQQMAKAFIFRLVRSEMVQGVDCYVLDANPDPDYRPPVDKARVLTGMQGRMWIDKEHFHWVKVQADVIRPVEFGYFVAKVKPGTRFELTQEPVGDHWLPKEFTQDVNASILGFYGYRTREVDHYSAYQSNSAALAAAVAPTSTTSAANRP